MGSNERQTGDGPRWGFYFCTSKRKNLGPRTLGLSSSRKSPDQCSTATPWRVTSFGASGSSDRGCSGS